MTYRSSIICSAIIGALAFSFPVHAQQKTAKACQEEWRANKADNQAKGVTEKAYVTQCRSGAATAQPQSPSPASSSSQSTTAPAAPAATTAAKPATQQRGTPATAAPAGDNQYVAEAQAKARCPSDTVVWVNLSSKIYHFAGHKDYGHTKSGAYMCEKDAVGQGLRASKAEKRA